MGAARIEVDESLAPVRIPGSVLNEIFDDERIRALKELVAPYPVDEVVELDSIPRDARHAFHMSPSDTLRVMNEAELRGERVHGVYHSHVGVEAYFSELDQEYALQELFPFPDCEHIVISVVPSMRLPN